ncbi:alpha-D-ribose 1-methylphosphonate 5-triphosphate synthase subunit PhnH [Bradyrhizobium sp. CIR48]|uniref:phosphonate C-P lyase system protein PhnH n=1 Tax=Bradyrhizobium sp. CIR48 TaxID=2663840 RepID=UPI001605AC3C|nr:alpha-D-ribose 1-methylphosphonate 5-triphosphate synthase subunit PhnH [Bradyrhizobium sp. CIR48]
MSLPALSTGLSDPIHQSQAVFRTVLQSMARPGIPRAMQADIIPPSPFSGPVAALALTLFDSNVTLLLGPTYDNAAIRSYLHLHSGVRLVGHADQADFAVTNGTEEIAFGAFKPIDPRTPHLSSTVIIQVESLTGGQPVILHGPGVEGNVGLCAQGLPPEFWEKWDANAAGYPRGVDVILADNRSICGLPRTTRRA